MNVNCFSENLVKALPLLAKALPTFSQVPVLLNVLLEATSEGLFLTTTDLEIGVKVKVAAKVEQEGLTTVSGKHFFEVLSSLPPGKITLALEKDVLVLTSEQTKLQFNTISKDEFPNILESKGQKLFTFPANSFKTIFSQLIYAVSPDESRPQLTGVLFSQKPDGVDLVATDGYRLSVKKTRQQFLEKTERLIISSRFIQEALLLKGDTEQSVIMYLQTQGNQVVFEAGDTVMVGRIIQGEFPSYEKVIPTSSKTTCIVDKDEFLRAIRLVSVFARESANIVKLKIEDKKLHFFAASAGVGEGQISIEVEQDGEDNEISYNVKYLVDFLRNSAGKKIQMELSSSFEPGIFRIVGDISFLHVIMPVRVQD